MGADREPETAQRVHLVPAEHEALGAFGIGPERGDQPFDRGGTLGVRQTLQMSQRRVESGETIAHGTEGEQASISQLHPAGSGALECHGQPVEPQRPRGIDVAGDEKNRRGQAQALENGRGVREIVAIAVVEGDGERVPRDPALLQSRGQILDGHDAVVTSDIGHAGGKDRSGQRRQERVIVIVDAVKREDLRARSRMRPRDAAGQGAHQPTVIERAGEAADHSGAEAHRVPPCRSCQSSSMSRVQSLSP